jgi:hypothetical protein
VNTGAFLTQNQPQRNREFLVRKQLLVLRVGAKMGTMRAA